MRSASVAVTWANMTEADKRRQAEIEATDRAEDLTLWAIALFVPVLMLYGWFQPETWVTLWHVAIISIIWDALLAFVLIYQRRTAT